MTFALTGATGFLGGFLLPQLVARGAVRALVRRPEGVGPIREAGATPVTGNLDGPTGCADLVAPGDVVIHAAARVDMTGTWQDFAAGTVASTDNLLAAILPRRPSRFVYVSSAAVYLRPPAGTGPIAADRLEPQPSRYNLYGRAKLAAEKAVRRACDAAGCPWVIVRLGFLYGPGNRALLRRIVPLLRTGRLMLVGRGDNRVAAVHVADAAEAVALAGTHPAAPARVYDVAADEPVTQRQFWEGTADALGLPRPARRVPVAIAMLAAAGCEVLARLTGGTPPFTRAMVALMGADQCVDAGAIRRELGWTPRITFAEGLRQWRQTEQEASRPEAAMR